MFMQYQGGSIGHSSTRDTTNRFLLDHHLLDLSNDNDNIEDEGSKRENAGGDNNDDDDNQSSVSKVMELEAIKRTIMAMNGLQRRTMRVNQSQMTQMTCWGPKMVRER